MTARSMVDVTKLDDSGDADARYEVRYGGETYRMERRTDSFLAYRIFEPGQQEGSDYLVGGKTQEMVLTRLIRERPDETAARAIAQGQDILDRASRGELELADANEALRALPLPDGLITSLRTEASHKRNAFEQKARFTAGREAAGGRPLFYLEASFSEDEGWRAALGRYRAVFVEKEDVYYVPEGKGGEAEEETFVRQVEEAGYRVDSYEVRTPARAREDEIGPEIKSEGSMLGVGPARTAYIRNWGRPDNEAAEALLGDLKEHVRQGFRKHYERAREMLEAVESDEEAPVS